MIKKQNASAPNKGKKLRDDLKRAEVEVARYVAAIDAGGGKLESLVAALAAAEARRDALRRELAEMESAPALSTLKDKGLEERLRRRAAQWIEVLKGEPTLARQGLRSPLAGPIMFTPDREG